MGQQSHLPLHTYYNKFNSIVSLLRLFGKYVYLAYSGLYYEKIT